MATLMLVPRAWLGRWVWDRVTEPLRAAGHDVRPLPLPGLADRRGELRPEVGLRHHADDVVARFRTDDLRDALLVGHRYAGAVVGAVARRIPERIRGQAYLDTMPLAEGRSLLDEHAPDARLRIEAAVTDLGGTRVWPMPEPLGRVAPVDGPSAADLALPRRLGSPHPFRTFEERLGGPVAPGPYPAFHAISCGEDDAAGAAEKVEFLASHPGWTYHHLPPGPGPMLSSPRELAAILDAIART